MNSKQNCWLAAYVFANTNRLFLWPLSSLNQCFLSVQFATICSNQSVLTDIYQKSFQVLVLKMLTFCYPGLNKVTLVNQLSLLLICKTAIGETWNAAKIGTFNSSEIHGWIMQFQNFKIKFCKQRLGISLDPCYMYLHWHRTVYNDYKYSDRSNIYRFTH